MTMISVVAIVLVELAKLVGLSLVFERRGFQGFWLGKVEFVFDFLKNFPSIEFEDHEALLFILGGPSLYHVVFLLLFNSLEDLVFLMCFPCERRSTRLLS